MTKNGATWLAIASITALLVGAAAVHRMGDPSSRESRNRANAILMKKDADATKPGRAAETVETGGGPNDQRNPDSTPDIEAYLQRAYPASDIPIEATLGAQ